MAASEVPDGFGFDLFAEFRPGHDRLGDLVDRALHAGVDRVARRRVEVECRDLRLGGKADEGVAVAERVVEERERLVLGEGGQPERELAKLDRCVVSVHAVDAAGRDNAAGLEERVVAVEARAEDVKHGIRIAVAFPGGPPARRGSGKQTPGMRPSPSRGLGP